MEKRGFTWGWVCGGGWGCGLAVELGFGMKLFPGVAVAAAVPTVAAIVAKRALDSKAATINATSHPSVDGLLMPPPVTSAVLDASDGAAIHYVDTRPDADPTLPTVVLCHGITAQWRCWSPVMHGLTESHRVIAWDMRGHGRSTTGSDGVTIAAAARDLAELLTHLGLTRAVVAGHSMGGMELCRFFVDHTAVAKQRVQGALFLATSANANTGNRRTGGWARSSGAILKVASLSGDKQIVLKKDNPLAMWFVASGYGKVVSRSMVDFQIDMQNEMSPRAYQAGMASIAQHQVEHELRQRAEELASIDIAVISATLDRLTPPIHGRGIVRSLPHASWQEVATAGHNVLLEQPEVVVDCLNKLLVG